MQQFLTKQWLTYRLPMDTLSILNAKKVSRIDILRWLHTVAVRADVVILTARFTGEAGCMKECIHSSAAALSSLYSESASVTHTCGKECNRMRWVLWGDGTWWVLWGDGTQWVLWGDGTWWVLWGDGTWWVLWGDGTQWVLWGDGTWWVLWGDGQVMGSKFWPFAAASSISGWSPSMELPSPWV